MSNYDRMSLQQNTAWVQSATQRAGLEQEAIKSLFAHDGVTADDVKTAKKIYTEAHRAGLGDDGFELYRNALNQRHAEIGAPAQVAIPSDARPWVSDQLQEMSGEYPEDVVSGIAEGEIDLDALRSVPGHQSRQARGAARRLEVYGLELATGVR